MAGFVIHPTNAIKAREWTTSALFAIVRELHVDGRNVGPRVILAYEAVVYPRELSRNITQLGRARHP